MRSGFVFCLLSVTAFACGTSTPSGFHNEAHPSATGGSAGMGGAVPVAAVAGAAGSGVTAGAGAPSGSAGTPGTGGVTAGAGGTLMPVMPSGAGGYPYDPSVTFDWPVTMPMAGNCQPGTYSGQFSCDVDQGFFGKVTYSGPV